MAAPELSIVVVIVSDTVDHNLDYSHLRRCLAALKNQRNAPVFEVLVPHYPAPGIAEMQRQFPWVQFIESADLKTFRPGGQGREHHDELRARGLAMARGRIIGLLEDHGVADPDWCRRAIESHEGPFAAVGGAIGNEVNRPLNRAVYFCDFLRYRNPVTAGESAFASDANVTYKRAALEKIGPVWQEIFHETAVHGALLGAGEKIALNPGMVVNQNRGTLSLSTALRERYVWGRSYAGTRSGLVSGGKRLVFAVLSPVLPLILLLRMFMEVRRKGSGMGAFIAALPFTAALLMAWSWGELAGYLTGRAHSGGAPAAAAILRGSTV